MSSPEDQAQTTVPPDSYQKWYDQFIAKLGDKQEPLTTGETEELGRTVMHAALSRDVDRLGRVFTDMQWLYGRHTAEDEETRLEQARLEGMLTVARWGLRSLGAGMNQPPVEPIPTDIA